MTTVKNGSSITYNRSGTTIDSLTAQGTNIGGSSTANIVRSSSATVVLLSSTSSNYMCNLPSSAEVGDVVEVYLVDPPNGGVFPDSGSSFIDGASNYTFSVSAIFRKVSSTEWAHIGT